MPGEEPTRAAEATQAEPRADAFPIVAIGASAGGVEAVGDLLAALPEKTGLAFVVVTHMDPRHASHLPETLQRRTAIPVREAAAGERLVPDAVFVIPPDGVLTVVGGVFHVRPRGASRAESHVIDAFFRSLAMDAGPRAVGIVLSGTLSDGSRGLQDIREADGLTFAQDPATATHPDMPRNAIASGVVDFVLAPADIARELARSGGRVDLITAAPTSDAALGLTDAELTDILRILRQRTGVDLSDYRRTTLVRRIGRRMVARDVRSPKAYTDLLASDRDEPRALYEEALIHVTRFFREEDAYQELQEVALEQLLKDRDPEAPLRAWVPGCATGEEAYSLAIILTEALQARQLGLRIQVFATDISAKAVAKAREGLYPASIADEVSADRLVRFFDKVGAGYQIRKDVRSACVFAVHDVASDPPYSNIDLVSCRNVLVYMEPELQRRVLRNLHYALKPSGFLVLGTSEGAGRADDLFATTATGGHVFRKLNVVSQPWQAPRPPPHLPLPGQPGGLQAVPGVADDTLQREVDQALLERFAPAGIVMNANMEVVQFRGRVPFLEHAPGPASLSVLRLLPEALAIEVRSAMSEARDMGKPVRRSVHAAAAGAPRVTVLEVVPLPQHGLPTHFLVLFPDAEQATRPQRAPSAVQRLFARRAEAPPELVAELERELKNTREHLRTIVEEHEAAMEELRSANEEAVSANEELQSANEELETAKEELQSTNEELTALNEELQQRNLDVQRVNNDLLNLLNSVDMPVLMLGPDLRIRRFTPKAQQLLNIIPTDLGRLFSDLRSPFEGIDLQPHFLQVLESFTPRDLDAHDKQGRHYVLHIRPYRTGDNRVDGVVCVMSEVTETSPARGSLAEAVAAAELAGETMWDPVVVLDGHLRVKAANAAFHERLRIKPGSARDVYVHELGDAVWDRKTLRHLLEEELPKRGALRDAPLPGKDPAAPKLVVNARALRMFGGGDSLLLVAIRPAPR